MGSDRSGESAALYGAAVVLLLAAIVAGAACGTGGDEGDAQPAPDVTVFRGGAFDRLPRYPRSTELAPPTETSSVTSQTFSVRNATPEEVLEFYSSRLAGWRAVEAVAAVGPDAYRGSWERDGRRLQVSAGLAPSVDVEAPTKEPPIVQYSLQLGPPAAFP